MELGAGPNIQLSIEEELKLASLSTNTPDVQAWAIGALLDRHTALRC